MMAYVKLPSAIDNKHFYFYEVPEDKKDMIHELHEFMENTIKGK